MQGSYRVPLKSINSLNEISKALLKIKSISNEGAFLPFSIRRIVVLSMFAMSAKACWEKPLLRLRFLRCIPNALICSGYSTFASLSPHRNIMVAYLQPKRNLFILAAYYKAFIFLTMHYKVFLFCITVFLCSLLVVNAQSLAKLNQPSVKYFETVLGKSKIEIYEKFQPKYRALTWEEMIKNNQASLKKKGWNLIFVNENEVSPEIQVIFKTPDYKICTLIGWSVPLSEYDNEMEKLKGLGYKIKNEGNMPEGDRTATLVKEGTGLLIAIMEISSRNLTHLSIGKN